MSRPRTPGARESLNTSNGAIHLYVRCDRCGAPVHVRVDPRNDLVIEYGEDLPYLISLSEACHLGRLETVRERQKAI